MSKTDTQKQNIHLCLAAILRDIDAIAKDRKNEQQGFKFRGIDDCYNHLHPIFAAHGVICLPSVEDAATSDYLNTKGNKVFHTKVKVAWKFVGPDGSFVEAKTVGEGLDFSDKSTAKAVSVAHKYLLLQTFLIPTADLIDGDQYDPTVMPREELAKRREEEAQKAVEQAVATGEPTELPEAQQEALEAKRKAAAESAAARDAQGETGKAVEAPAKPAKEPKPKKTAAAVEMPPADADQPKAPAKPSAQRGPDDPSGAPEEDESLTTLSLVEFKGKQLKELTDKQVINLKVNWVDKYGSKFATNPDKKREAAAVVAVFEARGLAQ